MFELVEPRVLLSADLLGLAGLPGMDLGDDQAPWDIDGVDASNLVTDLDDAIESGHSAYFLESPPESALQALAALNDPEESDGGAAGDPPWALLAQDLGEFDATHWPSELLIVDTRVPDHQDLIQGILDAREGDDLQIFILDPDRDGIAQISELLEGRQDIPAIHLVSHGSDDGLQLGSTWLSGENLDAYSAALAGWGEALSADADLLLYGCEIAADSDGQALVDLIAELTGADVAASTDLTGHQALGGDWELEYSQGRIEASLIASLQTQAQWGHVMALQAYEGFDYGAGSLDDANGGTGWGSAWSNEGGKFDTVTAGLEDSTDYMQVSGGSADLSTSGLETVHQDRQLASALGTPGTTAWVSFLVKPANPDVLQHLGLKIGTDTGTEADRLWVGYVGDDFQLSSGDGSGSFKVDNIATANTTYLLTLKMEFTAAEDDITLYIDPIPGGASPVTSHVAGTKSDLDLGTFTQLSITGGFGTNPSSIDELRVGSTYADVTPASIMVVDTTDDVADAIITDVDGLNVDPGADGKLSLREAILAANATAGKDVILFDIPDPTVAGTHTITLSSGLPSISSQLVIDGLSEPDYVDTPVIELTGAGSQGLYLDPTSDGSSIRGLEVTGFAGDGLDIHSSDNTIQGNIISGNSGVGIRVQGDDNLIGGTASGDGNQIFSNGTHGIRVSDDFVYTGNAFLGNIVHSNSALGIDLESSTDGGDSVTVNDAGDGDSGGNDLLNHPVMVAVAQNGADLDLIFDLDAPAGDYRIEFFENASGLDASGFGEGRRFLGALSVSSAGTGVETFSRTLAGVSVSAPTTVVATATQDLGADSYGSTSEFGPATGASIVDTDLWLSTNDDVSAGGQSGDDTWNQSDLITIGDPFLSLGPSTSGSFSTTFDADAFAPGWNLNAAHYVSAPIQIGSSSFSLLAGDLLLSPDGNQTLTSNNALALASGFAASVNADKEDLVVFRPDTPGDYSRGQFGMLLDDLTGGGQDLQGISLIEQTITVGGQLLEAGDFLYLPSSGSDDNDVWLYKTDSIGFGATPEAVDGRQIFLEGDDVGVGIGNRVFGIELLETASRIGDQVLMAGTLLVSVDNAEPVGSNDVNVDRYDVFALNVTTSTLVGAGQVTASKLFDGSDVAFDSSEYAIDAIALVPSASTVNAPPTLSSFANVVDTTDEDTEIEIGFSDLADQGNEADSDGTVDAFVVNSVNSGTLRIGVDAGSATAWATGSNDTIDAANKAYWTPDPNANGTLDAFDVVARDDQGADSSADVTARVSVTPVNDAPAGTDHTVTAAKNTDYVFSATDFGFTDPNDDPADDLAAVRISSLPAAGSLTLSGSGAVTAGQIVTRAEIDAGRLIFTPMADAGGTGYASFDFQVQDDGGVASGGEDTDAVDNTLTIDVVLFPVVANFDSYATNEDTPLVVAGPGLLDNDQINSPNFIAGATLDYQAAYDTDGDLAWQNQTAYAGYDFDLSGGGVTRILDPAGVAPGVTAAYVFDGSGGGLIGSALSSLPGDPTNEDATFELLFRPSDGVGQEILFESGGSHGVSLKLNDTTLELYVKQGLFGDLTTFDISAAVAANSYIHVFLGLDVGGLLSITDWSDSDGFAIGQADGPVVLNSAGADPFQGEIALFRFYDSALSAADKQQNFDAVTDLDAIAVTASGAGIDVSFNADGSFTYDPGTTFDYLPAGDSAIDTFTYTVADMLGRTDTATVAVTINGVNDDPTGSGSLTTTSLNDNAGPTQLFAGLSIADVDSGESDLSLTITLSDPTAGSLNGGGFVETFAGSGVYQRSGLTMAQADSALDSVQFTPSDNSGSSGSFTTDLSVTVNDQGGGGEQTVLAPTQVTISRVNDAPSFSNFADGVATTDEDTEVGISLATLKLFGDEDDVDGTVEAFKVKSIGSGTLKIGTDAASATPWATGSNDLIDATNQAYWTPAANENGLRSAFVAAAVDNAGVESSGTATALVSVRSVNDDPVFTSIAPTAATEEGAYSYSITTSDVEGDPLTFTTPTLPSWLTLVDHGDGTATLSGTPDDADLGDHTVVLRVNDGTVDTDQNFLVTVDPVNDLPVLGNPSLTLGQGETVTLTPANLSASDADQADGDLIFRVSGLRGGYFALKGEPDTAINEFTQDQVAAGEVIFIDDGDGTAPGFELLVDDGVDKTAKVAAKVDFTRRPVEPLIPEPEPEPELRPELEIEIPKEKETADTRVESEATEHVDELVAVSAETVAPAADTRTALEVVEDEGGESRSAADQANYRSEFNLGRLAQAVGNALRTDWFDPGEYLIEGLQRSEQFKQFEQLLGSDEFRDNLDRVRDQMEEMQFLNQTVVGSSAAVSTGLSVGYVAWLLRGGVLLSTVLSSMPAWNLVDPLPVLTSTRKLGADEDDDSLEEIIKKRSEVADDKEDTSTAR